MASGTITSKDIDKGLQAMYEKLQREMETKKGAFIKFAEQRPLDAMRYTFVDVTGATVVVRSRWLMHRDAVEFYVEGEENSPPLLTVDGHVMHTMKPYHVAEVLARAYGQRETERAARKRPQFRQHVEAEFVDTAAEEARRCDILRALG